MERRLAQNRSLVRARVGNALPGAEAVVVQAFAESQIPAMMLVGPASSGVKSVRLPCGCEFGPREIAVRTPWKCVRCGRELDPEAPATVDGCETRKLTREDEDRFADALFSALVGSILGAAEERKTLLEGAAQLQTQLRELAAENRRLRERGTAEADAEQAANNKRILDVVAALRRRLE